MKSTHKEELYIKQDPLTDLIFDDHSIFFDIETTGFSPASSTLYMIGCARKNGKYICIDQFFAENPEEECLVLNAFLSDLMCLSSRQNATGTTFRSILRSSTIWISSSPYQNLNSCSSYQTISRKRSRHFSVLPGTTSRPAAN